MSGQSRVGPRRSKEFAEAMRQARKLGWTVTHTNKTHLRWQAPDGTLIFTAHSPGSSAAIRAGLSRLRRAGLTV